MYLLRERCPFLRGHVLLRVHNGKQGVQHFLEKKNETPFELLEVKCIIIVLISFNNHKRKNEEFNIDEKVITENKEFSGREHDRNRRESFSCHVLLFYIRR